MESSLATDGLFVVEWLALETSCQLKKVHFGWCGPSLAIPDLFRPAQFSTTQNLPD